MGAFLTRGIKKGQPFACYPGWLYVRGDPLLPKDNSYQIAVPGTNLIVDAKGFDQSAGKAQFLNEGFTNEVKARISKAPDGANYLLAYALEDCKIHTEMTTTYDKDFWMVKFQWDQLSAADKVKAAEYYKIDPSEII